MRGISIVIPIYNVLDKYFCKCMDSVLNQDYKNIEIILVNDASTNGVDRTCAEYANKDNRVKYISLEENKGVSNARNIGIENAKYDWIMFVDGDDWIDFSCCEKIKNIVQSDVDVLIFDANIFFNPNNIKSNFFVNMAQSGYITDSFDLKMQIIDKKSAKYSPKYNCVGVTWGKLYRKKFIIENDLRFNKELSRAEDHVFFLDVLSCNPKVYYLRENLYFYRINQESTVNKINRNSKEIFKKTLSEIHKRIELNKDKELEEAYNRRVISYFLATLSNEYFHKDNKIKYKELIKLLDEIQITEPYKTALENLDTKLYCKKDRIRIFLMKKRLYFLLKILYKIKK